MMRINDQAHPCADLNINFVDVLNASIVRGGIGHRVEIASTTVLDGFVLAKISVMSL